MTLSTNFGLMIRILIIIIFMLALNHYESFGTQANLELKEFNHEPDFDRIFIRSASSPNYYVIHQDELNQLKTYLNTHKNTKDSLVNHFQGANKGLSDSLVLSKEEIKRLENALNLSTKSNVKELNYDWAFQIGGKVVFSVLILSFVFLLIKFFSMKKIYNSSLDSIQEIEKQFSEHKKNALERERKYVREIIDLKNHRDNSL